MRCIIFAILLVSGQGLLVCFEYKKVIFLANVKPVHIKSEMNAK